MARKRRNSNVEVGWMNRIVSTRIICKIEKKNKIEISENYIDYVLVSFLFVFLDDRLNLFLSQTAYCRWYLKIVANLNN